MKLIKLAIVSVLAIAALSLAGCFPVTTIEPVLDIIPSAPLWIHGTWVEDLLSSEFVFSSNTIDYQILGMTTDIVELLSFMTDVYQIKEGTKYEVGGLLDGAKAAYRFIKTGSDTMAYYSIIGATSLAAIEYHREGIPVTPVLTLPVALFTYSCDTAIQTDSEVTFNGEDSYDPNGEIVFGSWDFKDGTITEGVWTELVKVYKNGSWVWEQKSVNSETSHPFIEKGQYDVELTVVDNDGNEATITKRIIVE